MGERREIKREMTERGIGGEKRYIREKERRDKLARQRRERERI